MTPDITCSSLIQIGLQIPRWLTKCGRAREWLYLKCLCFTSSGIAYWNFAVWQLLCWAFLSCFIPQLSLIEFDALPNRKFTIISIIFIIRSIGSFVHLSPHPVGVHPTVCLSVHTIVRPSIRPFDPSIRLTIRLSADSSVSPFVYLPSVHRSFFLPSVRFFVPFVRPFVYSSVHSSFLPTVHPSSVCRSIRLAVPPSNVYIRLSVYSSFGL